MIVAHEDVGLAVVDVVVGLLGGAGHDEQLVAIDLHLGHLVGRQGVLDGQRMQLEAPHQHVQLLARRIDQTGPDELVWTQRQTLGRQRRLSQAPAVLVDVGGDDGHAGLRLRRPSLKPAGGENKTAGGSLRRPKCSGLK